MLKQMEVFLIAAVFLLMTAIILIFYTAQREREFLAHHKAIQQSAVHGSAYAVKLQLINKQRNFRLFLGEYQKTISHLVHFPGDNKTENDIKLRLKQRFPDFFTYTITDQHGVPMLMDLESLVGQACQLDLKHYAKKIQTNGKPVNNKIFIHPRPFHYHFDIMAPLLTGSKITHIFFASFYLKGIADILKTHQTPGQKLLLVKQSDPALIEVSSQGARDKLSREIRLSKQEQERIIAREDIPGTDWSLVNLPDADFVKEYIHRLWRQAVVIMLVMMLALSILITVIVKLTARRPA